MTKVLFICTSNKDRSPALEKYFNAIYPGHELKSAGVNKYFCEKNNTHYLTQDDIDWADWLIFAEKIHRDVVNKNFTVHIQADKEFFGIEEAAESLENGFGHSWKKFIVLDCGKYESGVVAEDYLTKADLKISDIFKTKKHEK